MCIRVLWNWKTNSLHHVYRGSVTRWYVVVLHLCVNVEQLINQRVFCFPDFGASEMDGDPRGKGCDPYTK